MNIFLEILKKLPPSKIEIIPNDLKDAKVSENLQILLNHYRMEQWNNGTRERNR